MNSRLPAVCRALFVAGLALAAVPSAPAESPPSLHSAASLRVGLWTLWHDKQVVLSPDSGTTLLLCETCAAAPLAHAMQVRADANRLELSDGRKAASIWLIGSVTLAAHGETLTLRNPVRITARSGELVLAVTLPVESYVERVVASESGPADSLESLKALAIVVRSFALHEAHGHADYELCDSTHCQLLHWGGDPERQRAAHAATLATAGETLWFHGQRAQAWFHQNCGGRTASPQEIWPAKTPGNNPMPWLVSRADPYCTANGAREWSASLSLADLTGALAVAGLAKPGWKTLTVLRRGESGRAVMLGIGPAEISGDDFRLAVGRALGWGKILSTWFEVTPQGDHFLFHGRGSGHGVGLCQAGSAAMAAAGRDSAQILAQYFPGAVAADETAGQPWQTLRAQSFVLETLSPADNVYLPQLSQALGEGETRSGLQPAASIIVRAFPSTPAFRNATLAPGWVASFAEGDWIATQPLSTLAARKMLVRVLRHEFLHAIVESQAAVGTPLWLREGLVEAWSDDAPPTEPRPTLKLVEIDRALAHAASEAQSQEAHRAAGWYAELLLNHYGRTQVLIWLRAGLPANVLAGLK